jgi:DNA replication protein DnaC
LVGRLDSFLGRLALDAGVPRRHIESFNARIETPAFVWANRWCFCDFLILSGSSGVGKSFSAAWVFREFLRSKIPEPLDSETWNHAAYVSERAMWITANRIVQDKNNLDEAKNKWFLVLDDLGREGCLSTRQADVSGIVSARYDAKLPTVITTELGFDDILKIYGRNTAYKLVEENGNGGMFVCCGNVSLRQETVNILGLDDEISDDC